MLALYLVEGIADGAAEILIRRHDLAIELELDDRLRPMDRLDLAFALLLAVKLKLGELPGGDIGGVFDDLVRLALFIEDRVVAGLQPNLAAALADALILAGIELAARRVSPRTSGIRASSRKAPRTGCRAGP